MKAILLSLFFLIAGNTSTLFAQNGAIFASVTYSSPSDPWLQLDIYHPDTTRDLPVVVFFHGGGWNAGDRSLAFLFAPSLVTRNIVCVGVQYRLSGMAKWPAQLHDCKGAIRFLKANAKQYHLDTTRFGAWGNSAGGHLAAMIGTSTDAAGTREYTVGSTTMDMEGNIGGNTNVTSKVQAVCNWFGPTDFLRMNDTPTSIDHLSPSSPESQLLGCPVLECPEKAELANPVHFITEDDPYFLTMHGDIDDVVPLVASVLFDSALRAHNVNSIFKIIPNEGHGFAAQWFDTAAEFFRWRFYEQTQSVSKAPEEFYVSPNPTDGDVRIHAAAGSSIRLYDVLGSHYTVTIRAEDNDAVITLPQHSGIYYCLIEKGNMIRRVMLMRR